MGELANTLHKSLESGGNSISDGPKNPLEKVKTTEEIRQDHQVKSSNHKRSGSSGPQNGSHWVIDEAPEDLATP